MPILLQLYLIFERNGKKLLLKYLSLHYKCVKELYVKRAKEINRKIPTITWISVVDLPKEVVISNENKIIYKIFVKLQKGRKNCKMLNIKYKSKGKGYTTSLS